MTVLVTRVVLLGCSCSGGCNGLGDEIIVRNGDDGGDCCDSWCNE